MKLAGKIILIYMFAMTLLIVVYGYAIVLRQDARLKLENEAEVHSMGTVLTRELSFTWQERGHAGVAQLIDRVNGQHQGMAIRWVALDTNQIQPELAGHIDHLREADAGRVVSIVSRGYQRMYFPIDVANERAGCVEFLEPLTEVDQYTRGTVYQTTTLMLSMLFCGAIVSLLGIRMVGRRLDSLIEKTQRIGAGDFSKPLQLPGHDELNQLAVALNEMSRQLEEQQQNLEAESTARLAAVEQLRHVDRLNTVGRLASGVAHELGTPLNVVAGRAELIAAGRLDEVQSRESAQVIKSEADRMTNIIRQLLDFARRRSPQRTMVDLRHVAEQCLELLRSLAAKQGVQLMIDAGPALTANVDASQIQQVLTNLVVNAIQSMPEGGTVTIRMEQMRVRSPAVADAQEGDYCCIAISDEGIGIAQSDRGHLFEPFFTTKDVGEGTGLGLSVSYGIVQDHNGWIDVQSEPGSGSCFTVFLPIG